MRKGYIICVDDEVSILETLSQQLKSRFKETHIIEIANSAESALTLINDILDSDEIIEVVITDQVMPGMKGDEFLQKIHKMLPDAIKIMLTGQAGLDSAIHAINFGGLSRYMEKPWNLDVLCKDIYELTQKFRENLENQHLLKELERKVRELEEENKKLRKEE